LGRLQNNTKNIKGTKMVELIDLRIEELVVHKVGNKMRDEGIHISESLHDLDDSHLNDLALKFFLKPFSQDNYYRFTHDSEINLNEVYYFVKKIFNQSETLYAESINILKHLYDKSNHPMIKSGEFYMVYFKNYSVTDKRIDAIGIFKSENKDTFFKINQFNNNFKISPEKGININKLDKGCLIFNEDMEQGFKVLIVDTAAKSQEGEAQYWKKNFLNVKEIDNDKLNTRDFIELCNQFSANVFHGSQSSDYQDKFQFKNKAYQYLESNGHYEIDEFVEQVFQDEKLRLDFREFKQKYEEINRITPSTSFNISPNTVSLLKKKFNSLIKLDTGFDIKVTNPDHLEKGYDNKKGMYYYKVFYNQEN
jgi:hypothetical protein